MRRAPSLALAFVALAAPLAGCSNPDASPVTEGTAARPGSAGEPKPPAPPNAASEQPSAVKRTPAAALTAFASLYVNWDYRTLSARQRLLAAIAVGPARLAETQAAAGSAADPTLRSGHIENTGHVLSVAADMRVSGVWVIVTSERTSGSAGYQDLPERLHVTLARVAKVPGGYAVREWLPSS